MSASWVVNGPDTRPARISANPSRMPFGRCAHFSRLTTVWAANIISPFFSTRAFKKSPTFKPASLRAFAGITIWYLFFMVTSDILIVYTGLLKSATVRLSNYFISEVQPWYIKGTWSHPHKQKKKDSSEGIHFVTKRWLTPFPEGILFFFACVVDT